MTEFVATTPSTPEEELVACQQKLKVTQESLKIANLKLAGTPENKF